MKKILQAEDLHHRIVFAVIETVNDELKNIAQIEHSRHRSFNNLIANAQSAIAPIDSLKRNPPLKLNLSMMGNLRCFNYLEFTL